MDLTGMMALMIPILGIAAGIVAMFLRHQKEMAQLLHSAQAQQVENQELGPLREDVRQLKEHLNRLTIALDDRIQSPAAPTEVRQRLGDGQG